MSGGMHPCRAGLPREAVPLLGHRPAPDEEQRRQLHLQCRAHSARCGPHYSALRVRTGQQRGRGEWLAGGVRAGGLSRAQSISLPAVWGEGWRAV